jgi:hypothetical protein
MPHKMRLKLHEMTGYHKSTISRIIREGDVKHEVWKAYLTLLRQEVEAKAKEQHLKQERIAEAERLRSKLVA